MMLKQKRKRHTFFAEEGGVFQALHDARGGLSADAAWDYMDRYIKLKTKARQLEKKGLKVKILLPDLPRRPLLIIVNSGLTAVTYSRNSNGYLQK